MRKSDAFFCTEEAPVAETRHGKVHGYQDGDVYCFLGMDYAKARRFAMPEELSPWDGVKPALDYGYTCPVMDCSLMIHGAKSEPLTIARRYSAMSEDCLNLNVWTKSIQPGVGKPVMVWFHGGGFHGGSATDLHAYEGWELAHNYDVVVVTVNHRLNWLGFSDFSEFCEEYRYSSNVGMADLVASLKWVRDNIAAFGGDPENVTIFGQSGGGGKVMAMMNMPSANGLYHKAIVQSGVFPGYRNQMDKKAVARIAAERLGITPENGEALQTVDYFSLLSAVIGAAGELGYADMDALYGFAPEADGDLYLGDVWETGFSPELANIPILAGTVLTEFLPSPIGDKRKWTDEMRLEGLRKRFGDRAEEIFDAFREAYPQTDAAYACAVDPDLRRNTMHMLDIRTQQSTAPVYNYVFSYEYPYLGGFMLGHNTDLHFMFHNACYIPGLQKPGVTDRVQDEMAGAWAAFARTGDPNHPGLPERWLPYTDRERGCMELGDHTGFRRNHDQKLQHILQTL